jgi:hypothetical protein
VGEGDQGDEGQPAPRARRVGCAWCCGDAIWLQWPGDVRKFCPSCGHQGARPREQCDCAPCVRARLAARGILVPE